MSELIAEEGPQGADRRGKEERRQGLPDTRAEKEERRSGWDLACRSRVSEFRDLESTKPTPDRSSAMDCSLARAPHNRPPLLPVLRR